MEQLYRKFVSWLDRRPNSTHFKISLIKSGFRIVAGVSLLFGSHIIAGALLVVAELLGIVEEL